jgi:O-antigen/teichoic acid export membrane protein
LLLGLGTALARNIAYSSVKPREERVDGAYALAAFLLAAPIIGLVLTVTAIWDTAFAYVFFGDRRLADLSLPCGAAIAGQYLHTLIYGYLLGHLRIWAANLYQLFQAGLVPVLALLIASGDARLAILLIGVATVVIGLIAGAFIIARAVAEGPSARDVGRAGRHLLKYGVPRVPGELSLFGMFAWPTFVVAHRDGLVQAGYFSFGLSVVQILSSMSAALSAAILPALSKLAAQADWDRLDRFVTNLLWISLLVVGTIVAAVEVFLPGIVALILGDAFLPAVDVTRWLLVGTLPYVAFMTVRTALDAVEHWPHNAVNLSLSLVVLVLLTQPIMDTPPVTASTLAFATLGGLSVRSWIGAMRRQRGPVRLLDEHDR